MICKSCNKNFVEDELVTIRHNQVEEQVCRDCCDMWKISRWGTR